MPAASSPVGAAVGVRRRRGGVHAGLDQRARRPGRDRLAGTHPLQALDDHLVASVSPLITAATAASTGRAGSGAARALLSAPTVKT